MLGNLDQDIIDIYNIAPAVNVAANVKWSPWVLRLELNPEAL